tara:strand:+ start:58 stop:966 length:909 start_codon:yes stop_codon:yes gene_type:complete
MKRSTKIISIIIIFFLIIASVIVARTMIGKHFQKKFGKRPPPGIIVTEVSNKEFSEKIDTFGTAVSNKTKSFRIKKKDLIDDLSLNSYVKKGEVIINLKSGNIIAPFNGVIGYTGLTDDIFVSDSTFIITLDDNSIIYSDIKIPENYSSVIEKGLPIEVRVSSFKNKIFSGEVDFISSRINAETRSLLTRIKIRNSNLELISGSLLEVSVKFNLRNSLSIPDTSVMMEGEKAYVYKVSKDNIVNKTEIKIGIRQEGNIEILSGLNIGDKIVAEGLKKVYPRSKIKPIESGSENSGSEWKKKT